MSIGCACFSWNQSLHEGDFYATGDRWRTVHNHICGVDIVLESYLVPGYYQVLPANRYHFAQLSRRNNLVVSFDRTVLLSSEEQWSFVLHTNTSLQLQLRLLVPVPGMINDDQLVVDMMPVRTTPKKMLQSIWKGCLMVKAPLSIIHSHVMCEK